MQDFSIHEYREQEKLSSDTSSIVSIDQYNLTSSTVIVDNQSMSSETTAQQAGGKSDPSVTPEVVLRKPQALEDYGTSYTSAVSYPRRNYCYVLIACVRVLGIRLQYTAQRVCCLVN